MAVQLAEATGATLLVVAVWSPRYAGIGYAPLPAFADVGDGESERAEQVACAVAGTARTAGVDVETIVCRGIPVEEICHLAEERRARLLVVGSHGWGRFRRMLLGSVSAAVIKHAPCPVLVVPSAMGAELDPEHGRVHAEV